MLSFIKNHLKIILLVSLPLFGIIMFLFNDETLFRMNPASLLIFNPVTEYFIHDIYGENDFITIPFLIIGANLLFWIPVALVINKLVSRRNKVLTN